MRTVIVSIVSVVGLAASATAGPSPAGGLTASTRTAASDIWTVETTVNPAPGQVNDSSFAGLSSSSASDTWAVGSYLDRKAFLHPLVEHRNATTWALVAAPQPNGLQATLSAVDDLSSTDVWAVGSSSSATASNIDERTLIEHWNGSGWSIVASPNPQTGSGADDVLAAIGGSGPTDLWAAGWDVNSTTIAMLFEHFDGTAWKVVASPSPAGSFQFANALTAIAPDDVWAVGEAGDSTTTLSAHWNGRRWRLVPTPSLSDGSSPVDELSGVTATGPDDVWASGYEYNVNDTNFRKPYVLHWNGKAWTLINTPNLGTEGSMLRDISALSPTDIWAVGQTQKDNGSILSLTEQFNGTSWAVVPSPDPGLNGSLVNNSLDALSTPASGVVFAAGARETTGQCCLRTLAIETTGA